MSQSTTDASYRTSRTEELSTAVVKAVARAEGVDPSALETPLYEAVDPDALNDLVSPDGANRTGGDVRIRFTYHGYEVRIDGGEVTLWPK